MLILVINSGSSSLKYQLRELKDDGTDTDEPIQASGLVERIGVAGSGIENHTQALGVVAEELHEVLDGRTIDATGHRVVHGGERFTAPALVTPEVIRAIDRLRSEEHTSELQSRGHLVCRLLLEKKKKRVERHETADTHHGREKTT